VEGREVPSSTVRDALLNLRIVSAASEAPVLPVTAGPDVEVWLDRDGDVVAQGYTVAGQHWLHFPGFASYRFGQTPGAITAIPAAATSADAVRDCHRRFVLPLALQALGIETLHASGVVIADGMVAFCGFPRTGKSTLAYGLHRRGYALWADDSVALHAAPKVEALPLPFRIRLRPTALAFFGAEGLPPPPPDEPPDPRPPHGEPALLAAVFVLIRSTSGEEGAGPRVRRLPPAAAFHAVLSHAQCFSLRDRMRKQRMLELYLALAGQTPVLELRFEPGFDKLAAVLDVIEQAMSGSVPGTA